MKRLYLLPVLLLALAACRKNEAPASLGPSGCITQRERDYFGIKAADSLQAVKLFQQNNIKYDNLVFERVILNDTITNTEGTTVYNHVVVIQYFNGLPILSDDGAYHFRDGLFYLTSGNLYTSINLDNHPTTKLTTLSSLYIAQTRQEYNTNYRDSCVVAQFGYFNLHAGTADNTPSFIKAWRVTPKNSFWPVALYRDDNAKLIYYDNGIRTFQ